MPMGLRADPAQLTVAMGEPRRGAVRGIVRSFSRRSGSRLCRYLRASRVRHHVMGTLTYPAGDEWRSAKPHWRSLVERLRRAQPGINLCWFLEFQANGRPHFHFFADQRIDRHWLARAWAEIVGCQGDRRARHESAGTRIERLRSGRRGATAYARKYAAKLDQKTLPTMLQDSGFGRFWGIVGDRSTVAAATTIRNDEIGSEIVRAALDSLRDHLRRGIERSEIRHRRLDWCHVYSFSSEEVGLATLAKVEEVARACSLHREAKQGATQGVLGARRGADHLPRDSERGLAGGDHRAAANNLRGWPPAPQDGGPSDSGTGPRDGRRERSDVGGPLGVP